MDPKLGQSVFSTPELAAQALVNAISAQDKDILDKIILKYQIISIKIIRCGFTRFLQCIKRE